MRVLVFVELGAGARAQAAVLAERLDVAHVDPGLLAAERGPRPRPAGEARSCLRGAVCDEDAVRLLLPRLRAAAETGGWVLSGFPCTLPQAVMLTEVAAGRALDVEVAVRLDVPRSELTDRLVRRGATARQRGARTARLIDDRVELGPLSGLYRCTGRLLTIDGSGTQGQVASDLLRGLHGWLLDRRLAARGQGGQSRRSAGRQSSLQRVSEGCRSGPLRVGATTTRRVVRPGAPGAAEPVRPSRGR